ncbi:flavin reductase family protein [Spongiibacter taiwanensis]|uniref:flavin reductase family protein n=1 Tax=Spongiibacter taiwanensis TaxID=1748242 RepID=UPI0020354D94|nr:flavin reductase family protein [Spongiibacter taiwanensis]USA43487.1 flavin reductase family protein [Spongiibacter taiwanensis]
MNLDQRQLRNALGQFATGVCVVTANAAELGPFGMTVNSFSSVSLDPPLVLWSLRNDSECFEAFRQTRFYAINVLRNDQQQLSNQYASPVNHRLSPEHFSIGKTGSPVLRGVLCTFECEIWQRYDGGDHTILVGKVLESQSNPTGKPLVFHGGLYRELW